MEKFQHEYEIIMADIEKTERNAERFVLLTRAIKNQKFFHKRSFVLLRFFPHSLGIKTSPDFCQQLLALL